MEDHEMSDQEKEQRAKAVLDSLRDIINTSAESIEGNAIDEMRAMAHQLSAEFRKALPDECETAVFSIGLTPDEDLDEAIERYKNGETLVSPYVNEVNRETAKCAKVESVINGISRDDIFRFLEDSDGMLLLNGAMNPQGLIVRIKQQDGSIFEVFTTDNYVTVLTTLATGDKIMKQYSVDKDESPDRDDYRSDYEFDVVKATYTALTIPHMIKQLGGEGLYDAMLAVVQAKMERQMRYNNED